MPYSRACVLLCCLPLFLFACGDDEKDTSTQIIITEGDMSETDMSPDLSDQSKDQEEQEMVQSGCGESGVAFQMYTDTDRSSLTGYGQRIQDPDAVSTDVTVKLMGAKNTWDAKTCADGTVAWTNVPDGTYLLSVPVGDQQYVTSSNQSRRLPKAIESGTVNILTFGDSIPAYGPRPWFPSKLADQLEPLAQVNNNNVAVPGSESTEWLPGTFYYNSKLKPALATADVIVFSLGGNDLYNFANSLGGISQDKLTEKYDEFQLLVEDIKVNLKTLVADIRAINPDADIVWILYPNYAKSTYWADIAGSSINLVETLLQRTLIDVRKDIGKLENLLIVDMLNAMYKRDLNQYLIDPLHLNQPGHDFYTQEIFRTLGGVTIKGGVMFEEDGPRKIGLANMQ